MYPSMFRFCLWSKGARYLSNYNIDVCLLTILIFLVGQSKVSPSHQMLVLYGHGRLAGRVEYIVKTAHSKARAWVNLYITVEILHTNKKLFQKPFAEGVINRKLFDCSPHIQSLQKKHTYRLNVVHF